MRSGHLLRGGEEEMSRSTCSVGHGLEISGVNSGCDIVLMMERWVSLISGGTSQSWNL